MKKIVLFEPSISSLNLGDYVIVNSVKRELHELLKNAYVVEQPTQLPLMHWYQRGDKRLRLTGQADYKFVCGSNLFWQNMLHVSPQWNVNIANVRYQRGLIFVGVGSGTIRNWMDPYSNYLYRKILNPAYLHSVRDEATKRHVESLGFQAINTGCVTMWSLTKAHCEKIPKRKSENVVFTLTDYLRDFKDDRKMIEILLRNYHQVWFWPQGYRDYEYLIQLGMPKQIHVVSPNLESLQKLFLLGNIDYVGTRLHGGIFAMQNQIRSIIVSIDNRARDMRANYAFPCVERDELDLLEPMIQGEWDTSVNISEERIRRWKAQFDFDEKEV